MIQDQTIARRPRVLTTGQVARICNVAPRTVSKWFDLGQLRGYRIPGSRDRRIPVDQLVRFMKAHNMPLNGLDSGETRVLLLIGDIEFGQSIQQHLHHVGFEVRAAMSSFEAGVLVERFRPHVVVLDLDSSDTDASAIASALRIEPQLSGVKLLALDPEPRPGDPPAGPGRRGFDARLARPFNIGQLIDTISGVIG